MKLSTCTCSVVVKKKKWIFRINWEDKGRWKWLIAKVLQTALYNSAWWIGTSTIPSLCMIPDIPPAIPLQPFVIAWAAWYAAGPPPDLLLRTVAVFSKSSQCGEILSFFKRMSSLRNNFAANAGQQETVEKRTRRRWDQAHAIQEAKMTLQSRNSILSIISWA